MTDYASVGAARVRHCHCHDEPWASAPTRVEDGQNPARISSKGRTFVGALIGSIRGRFAQMPMLVGRANPAGGLVGGTELIMNPLNPKVFTRVSGRATDDLGVTQGTPLGSTIGASTLASPLGIAVGAERVPQNALEEALIPLENKLGPYGVLVGAAAGGLAAWIAFDAVQSAKDAEKFNASSTPASSDRRRSRRRRWL